MSHPYPYASRPVRTRRPRVEALEGRSLLTAGALDATFGTAGKVMMGFQSTDPNSVVEVRAVTVYPSTAGANAGKILAVGFVKRPATTTTSADFGVFRYNANGTPDTTFGTNGMVTTDFNGGYDMAYGVAIDAAGKIVAAGSAAVSSANTTPTVMALARYNSNGSLDTDPAAGFGPLDSTGLHRTGKVTTAAGSSSFARGVVIQPADGKIVVGGTGAVANASAFAVARYNTDGSADAGFGTGGLEVNVIAKGSQARAIALQPDGRFVLAGYSYDGTVTDFAAARYTTGGALDASFGTGGTVSTQIGTINKTTGVPVNDQALGLAIDPQGRPVLAGFTTDTSTMGVAPPHAALVRYTTSGTLDTSFGGTGKVVTSLGSTGADRGRAVVVQPDGKIVLAGDALGGDPNDYNFALARFTPAGALDGTFGTGGKVVTSFTAYGDYALGVALQSDGRVIAGGSAKGNLALARYLGDSPVSPSRVTAAAAFARRIDPARSEALAGMSGYYVARPTDGTDVSPATVAIPGATGFQDMGPSLDHKYDRRTRSYNGSGNSCHPTVDYAPAVPR